MQQIKEVGAVTQEEMNTECKILTYISLALTIFGLVMVAILHYKKSKLCRGYMFSNAVKIMIFISDVQYYVPIKLCKTTGSIHLFKTTGTLNSENIKLNRNYVLGYLRNRLEGGQHNFNGNKVNLPKLVTTEFKDKFNIKHVMKKEQLLFQLFHVMLKQGITWFTLTCNTQETVQDNTDTFPDGFVLTPQGNMLYGYFWWQLPEDTIDMEVTLQTMKGIHTFQRDHSTHVISCRP